MSGIDQKKVLQIKVYNKNTPQRPYQPQTIIRGQKGKWVTAPKPQPFAMDLLSSV